MKGLNFKYFALLTLLILLLFTSSSCTYYKLLTLDKMSPYLRSEFITSKEDEDKIMAKASASWTSDRKIRVLYLSGTDYEIGYQQGKLLQKEIQDNLGFLYRTAINKFGSGELFDEVYERMRPYIPQSYVDEMHGLAHGSKLPLNVIHAIHILPEIGEWGGKKQIKKIINKMVSGELGTSCSNFSLSGSSTKENHMYTVRILDWGMHRISKLHQYPLISVVKPDNGIAYANISWAGFIGAISGINAEGITLGEMGYGDPEGETLHGNPMPFMLRDILRNAKNLSDVRKIISTSPPTNSFVYLMSDGKTKEAELYVRDPSRFLVFPKGAPVKDKKNDYPPLKDVIYGGHYQDIMINELQNDFGNITLESLKKTIIPKFAMPSNFQNVIYDPVNLKFWVNNAKDKDSRAAEQPYTEFDFGKALEIVNSKD